jgi:hypothetical protein
MLTPDYIVGLVDGEGSFTVYVRGESASKRRRAKVEPRFFVKLKATDKPLLDALKSYFQCGNVYIQKDKRANHSLCWRYEVANRAHIRDVIIPFFQKHNLHAPSKQKDFVLFCRIMALIEQGVHFTDSGMQAIKKLKAQMHGSSPDAGNPHVGWERQC